MVKALAGVVTAFVEDVDAAQIVAVVDFVAAVELLQLALALRLAQSRRPSHPHGMRLSLLKSPRKMGSRLQTRLQSYQTLWRNPSRQSLRPQRRRGLACSLLPNLFRLFLNLPLNLPPPPKSLRLYPTKHPSTTLLRSQLFTPKSCPYPQLQTTLSKNHPSPSKTRPN